MVTSGRAVVSAPGAVVDCFHAGNNKLPVPTTGNQTAGLPDAIREIWASRRTQLEQAPISTVDFERYIESRAKGQLAWFLASRHSIEGAAEKLGKLVLALFAASALGVVFKAAAFALGWTPPTIASEILNLALLLSTAASAALAAVQQGQNGRSVRHAYAYEESQIRDWITTAEAMAKLPIAGNDLARQIAAFEANLIDELIAWIGITEGSLVELSP